MQLAFRVAVYGTQDGRGDSARDGVDCFFASGEEFVSFGNFQEGRKFRLLFQHELGWEDGAD
jgi:hypothetical protein